MTVADEIKGANQLTVRQGDYFGLYTWAQNNHESLEVERKGKGGGQTGVM